jgi:carboxymethylenebutenolidase
MDILKPPGGKGPGVVVAHPWWGLNHTVRDYGAALARAGFTVGLPDLFDGQVATTPDEAEKLARGNWNTAAGKLTTAANELKEETAAPVAAIGFSFGAFHLAQIMTDEALRLRALAIYYATFGPVPAKHPPMLAHLAELDSEETPADMRALSAALAAAGPPNAAYTYPGMRHWFAEPDRPEYDPAAAKLAFDRTVAFLRG